MGRVLPLKSVRGPTAIAPMTAGDLVVLRPRRVYGAFVAASIKRRQQVGKFLKVGVRECRLTSAVLVACSDL